MSRAPLSPRRWLAGNGVKLAPLTGQDARALDAIAACWEVYAAADDVGRRAAIRAVRDLLFAMQPKCRELTKMLIARSLDWGDVDRLWTFVVNGDDGPARASSYACNECGQPVAIPEDK